MRNWESKPLSRGKRNRLYTSHKTKTTGLPFYLFKNQFQDTPYHYLTRSVEKISSHQFRTESFKSSFFPWTIVEWNKLESKLSSSTFKEHLVKDIKPPSNSVFNIYNSLSLLYSNKKTVWRIKNKWCKLIKTAKLQN